MIKVVVLFFFSVNFACAGQLTGKIENDGTFGDDGHYTSGLYLSWESRAVSHSQPSNIRSLPFRFQQALLFPQAYHKAAWSIMLSQRMWTPLFIKMPEPQLYDRPYAGVIELTSTSYRYSANTMQSNWLAIGITGPASLSGQLQVLFHETVGAAPAQGWDTQLKQSPIWQFGYNIEKLLIRQEVTPNWQWDVSVSALADVGSFRSEAFLGATFRLGQQLNNSFGRINNRYGNSGNLIDAINQQAVFTYIRAQLGYRFNDLTLEGDFPYQSPIDRQAEQQKYSAGIQWVYHKYLFDFSINAFTADFISDSSHWHGYGGFSIAIGL